MSVSDQTLLDSVNNAINAILTGQVSSWSQGQSSLQMLSLRELREMKTELEKKINAQSGGYGPQLIHPYNPR